MFKNYLFAKKESSLLGKRCGGYSSTLDFGSKGYDYCTVSNAMQYINGKTARNDTRGWCEWIVKHLLIFGFFLKILNFLVQRY